MKENQVSFHRKYRPTTLNEVIGNAEVKQSVGKILLAEKKPQVILLYGKAGCGKTSMARIIAKNYSCEHTDALGNACNECEMCKLYDDYIKTGSTKEIWNVKEYNSADINKEFSSYIIDEMYSPNIFQKTKIYIFDECHLLTTSAMGNLLKVFEEPPEKVLIILCTTNPERLLDTIRSRCEYKLEVKTPKREETVHLLENVCLQENINYDIKGLAEISKKEDNTPRNSLLLLGRLSQSLKGVCYEDVSKALNIVVDNYYFKFFEYLIKNDVYNFIKHLGEIKEKVGIEEFVEGLKVWLQRGIYIFYGIKQEGETLEEIKQVKKLFKQYDIRQLNYLIEKVLDIDKSNDKELELQLLGLKGISNVLNIGGKFDNPLSIEQMLSQEQEVAKIEFIESTTEDITQNEVLNKTSQEQSVKEIYDNIEGEELDLALFT